MRRGQIFLLSIVALLVAVPIAGADDKRPIAGPGIAVGVTSGHAVLHAIVDPGDKPGTAAFEYGTTTAYGASVVANPASLPKKGVVATAQLSGLAPATTYHFRALLSVAGVTVPGPDTTFTTAAAPGNRQAPGKTEQPESDPAPAPVEAPAAPVQGRSVALGPVAGTVRVRKPHGRVVTLAAGADVPTGSVVDASQGTVALTSALAGGATQTAHFGGGRFVVRQSRRGRGAVDIYLRGSVGHCGAGAGAARAARKPRTRTLWGSDHGGRFRTHGANSVATVRGTRWLTQDSCAGTLTRVTQGVVAVRDLRRHRVVTVAAGHSYLARRER